jgi:hypothetical protein
VVPRARLVTNGGQECTVIANIVDPTRILDLPDLVGLKQIWQQFDVIAEGWLRINGSIVVSVGATALIKCQHATTSPLPADATTRPRAIYY